MQRTISIICGPDSGADDRLETYRVADVARRLGVSYRHVFRLARSGHFKIRDVDGLSVIAIDEVNAYLTREALK